MAVSDELIYISYTGAGIGTGYAYPFYFRALTDLVVTTVDLTGVINGGLPVSRVLNTDYTVSGTLDPKLNVYVGGGTVTSITDWTGLIVLISRRSPKQQGAVYIPDDPFQAGTLEQALDALALQHQELACHYQGYADGPPTQGAYLVDDWFFIRNAGEYGFKEIICVAAGTPGTWKPHNPIGA